MVTSPRKGIWVKAGRKTMSEVPFSAFRASMDEKKCSVDMEQVVGKCDILFICLDTLRYDAAVA